MTPTTWVALAQCELERRVGRGLAAQSSRDMGGGHSSHMRICDAFAAHHTSHSAALARLLSLRKDGHHLARPRTLLSASGARLLVRAGHAASSLLPPEHTLVSASRTGS
jgi:hypothetical protein